MRILSCFALIAAAILACSRDEGTKMVTGGHELPAPEIVAPDDEIEMRVREALANDPGVGIHSERIQVEIHGGVVTLRGSVADEDERAAVTRAARSVVGEGQVRDELKVVGSQVGGISPPVE
jgi:osmotically-inducible protein OsmY